jgi:hypothetical protein
MSELMIRCPNTGEAISTGITTDSKSFQALPDVASSSRCPKCGLDHVWRKREAWLDGQDTLNGAWEDASAKMQSVLGGGDGVVDAKPTI